MYYFLLFAIFLAFTSCIQPLVYTILSLSFNLYFLFTPYIFKFLLFDAPYIVLYIVIFITFRYISENKVINLLHEKI